MVLLMEGWPILVFSSYILEGCLVLYLCYRKSGLCSVVLWDGWPRLACVQ